MTVSVAIFLVAAASASTVPLVVVPPPPPAPVVGRSPPMIVRNGQPDAVVAVAVEIAASGAVLWSGTLQAQRSIPASFSQSKSDALPTCTGTEQGGQLPVRANRRRQELGVSLGAYEDDQFNLSVNWTRPVSDCATGTRGVNIEEIFVLRAGEHRRLTGDGGLVVTLARAK